MRAVLAGIVLAALAASTGCADDGGDTIRVFAAASLTDAFEELAEAFEAETGTGVDLQFAGSSVLATQIDEEAPADVFASANEEVMAGVAEAVDPVPFATNELVLALPVGTEASSAPLAPLARDGVITALCAAAVPCGSGADELLAREGVEPTRVTREADVLAVATKVELGEVDAGIVYATDTMANDALDAHSVGGPEIVYPISTIDGSAASGDRFVAFVLSATGQSILRSYGFGPPP